MDAAWSTRLFSLSEANALVPTLAKEFGRARDLRDQLMKIQEKLTEDGRGIDGPEVQVDPEAPPAVRILQERAVLVIGKLREILREVGELGVEVKAADGLVDFRSKLDGRVVYLCWRFGEEHIDHWHELDAGFSGRKPLPTGSNFVGDLLH